MAEFEDLGQALWLLRQERRLLQRDLAERAGLTPSLVSAYENSKVLPSIESLERILEGLGANLFDLLNALEAAGGRPKRSFTARAAGDRPPRGEVLPLLGLQDLSSGQAGAFLRHLETFRSSFLAKLKDSPGVVASRSSAPGGPQDLWKKGSLPEDSVAKALNMELEQSRLEAVGLESELLSLPREEALAAAMSEPRFFSWGLAERLCEKSRSAASEDPALALHFGRLAVEVASRASLRALPAECSRELLSLAYAHRGNALRVLTELRGARESFDLAEESWAGTTIRFFPFRPQVLSLRASLEIDLTQFDAALESLAEALILEKEGSQPRVPLQVSLLLKVFISEEHRGESERALAALVEAENAISGQSLPALRLAVLHNRMDFLTRIGRWQEARALRGDVELLARSHGSAGHLVKIAWTQGRLEAGLGNFAKAEELLRGARRSFLDRRQGYWAAVVSLELATLFFRQGKLEGVRRLALEMLPVFQAHDIHREALAALALFQQAAVTEQISEQLLADLVSYFHKAYANPRLRFRR